MNERNVLGMIAALREVVGAYGWWNLSLASEGDGNYRLAVNVRKAQDVYSNGMQLTFTGPDIVDVLGRATTVVLLMDRTGAISG